MTLSKHEEIIDKYILVISCATLKEVDFFIKAEKFLDTRSYKNVALILEDMIKGRHFDVDLCKTGQGIHRSVERA